MQREKMVRLNVPVPKNICDELDAELEARLQEKGEWLTRAALVRKYIIQGLRQSGRAGEVAKKK